MASLVYLRHPSIRLSHYDIGIGLVALVTAMGIYLNSSTVVGESIGLSTILFAINHAGPLLLLVAWLESLIRMGSQRLGLLFALAVVVYAACNGFSMLLRAEVAHTLMALTPLVSAALLVALERQQRRDSQSEEGASAPNASARQAISQNNLMLLLDDQPAGRRAYAVMAALVLLSVFFFRLGFCYAVERWIPLQDAGDISFWGQASNLLGALSAAFIILVLVATCWNRSTLLLVEACSLIALMTVLFLLFGFDDAFSRFGSGLVCFGTKLTLLITLTVPFLVDAKNPPFVLCLCLAVNMASLCVCSVASTTLNPQATFMMTVVCTGLLIVLYLSTFILVEGNYTESARVTLRRIDQSAFNEAEAWPREAGSPELETRCAEIATRYGLTQREVEVLVLLVKRYNAEEISQMLLISESTARTHMRKIYNKLGVHSQRELIKLTYE